MTSLSIMSLFSSYLLIALFVFAMELDGHDAWQALIMGVLWPAFFGVLAAAIVYGLALGVRGMWRWFVLSTAERMLRKAGVKRIVLSGPPHGFRNFSELGANEVAPDGATDGLDADTLAKAYASFVEVRRG